VGVEPLLLLIEM